MNWFRSPKPISQPEPFQPIVADLDHIERTIAQELASKPLHKGSTESAQEADYPTNDAITQAFTELTALVLPPPPKPPIKTQVKVFVGLRPWLFLPLLGFFPAIALTLDRLHPPQAPSIASSTTQPPSPRPISSQLSSFNTITSPANPSASANSLPAQMPVALKVATPASLVPIDLSKLTPAQKAMNAQAKAAFEATNAPVDAYVEMHVSIEKGSAIAFASNTAITVTNDQGKKISTLSASEVHTAQFSDSGLSIGGASLPAAVFLEPEPGGLLYLNNRPYRGKLLLAPDSSGQLHAINYINLRHYLYSVVASEVSPSWSAEAIKAQAVAARSYALTYYFKPAGKTLFHLGSDEYYQVYSGTQKEDDRSNQAVDATSGEYVSYKGGVVESLYAASDDIVAEAFSGKGMSQLGAKNLAEQGYKYDQILANYYPTTKIGKIAKDE